MPYYLMLPHAGAIYIESKKISLCRNLGMKSTINVQHLWVIFKAVAWFGQPYRVSIDSPKEKLIIVFSTAQLGIIDRRCDWGVPIS